MPRRPISSPYDPRAAGRFAVRQQTISIVDRSRGRTLPVEVWSPDAPGPRPLAVYSHSSYGSRLQSAELLRFLATQGYVAAAPDHLGNTADDVEMVRSSGTSLEEKVQALIAPRVPDLRLVISELVDRGEARGLAGIDASRIATIGWSFGGWAALAVPEADPRVRAVVAMVPAGGSDPLPGIIPARLTFDWSSPVATLVLAAERDRFTPLDRVIDVFRRAPEPRRGFVLLGADHDQFADVPETDAIPRAAAHAFRDALTLAHLDATLGDQEAAAAWLEDRAVVELRAAGVGIEQIAG